ncbi:Exopolygalacturonase clone GBGE184 [Linum grandiflorum]
MAIEREVMSIVISFLGLLSCFTQGSAKVVPRTTDTDVPHRGLHVVDLPNVPHPGLHVVDPPPNLDVARKIVDVMHFGAKANGKDDDSMAFTQAWEQVCQKCSEPSTLLIPQGTYVSSPVVFRGPCISSVPVLVEVRGTIVASDDLSCYKEDYWFMFNKINGLVINGGGTFDGRGATVWKDSKGKKGDRPSSIVIRSVDNAVVHDICSVDSKFFHYHVSRCDNFKAFNLRITAPDDSPNTDGMHLSSSNCVQVSNSFIGTGDDCISIGHGVVNANISGITCGPGHGISIGSLGKRDGETDVNGITVTNCTLTRTDNGVRIKTFASDIALQATQITFQDIIMNEVENPIIIDQHYGGSKKKTGDSRVKVSHVHYKNIRGTTTSNVGVELDCSAACPCDGIEFFDVCLDKVNPPDATSKNINDAFTATCNNVKPLYAGTNKIPMCM